MAVTAGVYYYIRVKHYSPANPDDRRYLLRCKNYPSTPTGDGDDDFDSATFIDFGEKYVGTLDQDDDEDYYFIESIPNDYDAFAVIVDTDFSEYDGSYKCEFTVYDRDENRVGRKKVGYGEVAYLKLPITSDGYYIRVMCYGDYDASKRKKYHLETIGIDCIAKRQTCIEAAIPIQVLDHYWIGVEESTSYFYSMLLEESREITFVTQTDLTINDCAIKLYDENKNLIAESDAVASARLTHRLEKEKTYYIELVATLNGGSFSSYLFYTEPYGVGGISNTQNMELSFKSLTAAVEPPYTLGQTVLFTGVMRNNTNHKVTRTIQATMRDENDPQGSGTWMDDDDVTVLAKDTEDFQVEVTMARTGFKDIVFEVVDSTVRKIRNCEIRGYTISEALNLVNRVEAFIKTKHPEFTTTQRVFDETLTYFRSLIYDQTVFNFMLGNRNPVIDAEVEKAFNASGNKEINRLINGTILEDNNNRIIDFIHMLAVLEGCMDGAKSNKEKNSLFTGWLGDIGSDGPNALLRMRTTTSANVRAEALKRAVFEECAQINRVSCKASVKDLEADIDAVAIYKLYRDQGGNTTLYDLLSKYYQRYSVAYTNRYATFKQETTRICGTASFNRCVYNAVLGQYDSLVGIKIAALSKGTDPLILIELGRLFTEYVNTEGQTKEGYDLIQNNVWWK